MVSRHSASINPFEGDLQMTTRLFVLMLLLLSGCATQVNTTGDEKDSVVGFHCANGEQVMIRFLTGSEVAILTRNGESIELRQQPAASGFWYTNGPISIRGKGNDLDLEIGRMVPI